MRKRLLCFCTMFVILLLSACGRNIFEEIVSTELVSKQTEQYQSAQDTDTENQNKVTVESMNNTESDMDEPASDYEEDATSTAEETGVISDEAYKTVLDEFRVFCVDTRERGSYSIEGTVDAYYHMYDEVLYYSYYDIDKNGVPELLISMGNDEDVGEIVDVFGLNGSEAVCIQGNDSLGDRSRLTIYADGTLYREDSGGASIGEYTFYRLTSNGYELEVIKRYTYDSDKMPAPFFNSSESLTGDEFYASLAHYEVASDIEWNKLEIEEIADFDRLYHAFTSTIGTECEVYFWQDDFDCDGQEEAFGITGIDDGCDLENVRIYYIASDAKVSCIAEISSMYGYGDSYFQYPDIEDYVFMDTGSAKFLRLGGSDGQETWLYGVKNGSAYQPEVSGKFCEFGEDEDNNERYYAYESNDGGEGVQYYKYNEASQEFVRIFQ